MDIKVIEKKFEISTPEMKQLYRLVAVCMEIKKSPKVKYAVKRSLSDKESLVTLMSRSEIDAKLASLPDLPPMLNEIHYAVEAAGSRAEEAYRVVAGMTEFPGVDPDKKNLLIPGGIEQKISDLGSEGLSKSEELESLDSKVTVSNPISASGSVAAYSVSGALDIVSVDPATGEVELADNGTPLDDGTIVSISYEVERYTIMNLMKDNEIVAVLVSNTLLDFIESEVE